MVVPRDSSHEAASPDIIVESSVYVCRGGGESERGRSNNWTLMGPHQPSALQSPRPKNPPV